MPQRVLRDGTIIGILGAGQSNMACGHAEADAHVDLLVQQVGEAVQGCGYPSGAIAVIHGPFLTLANYGRRVSAVAVVIIEPEVGCLQPTSNEELIDALASFLESMGSLPPFNLMVHHDGGHSGGKGAPSAVVEASGPVTRPDGSWAAAADYEVYQELYERCAAAHAHSVAANQR